MSIDIPSSEDLAQLTKHRNPASVSLYVVSAKPGVGETRARIVHDSEAAQLALRSAANAAIAELAGTGIDKAELDLIASSIQSLEADRDFWGTQARSLAVFAAPGVVRAYRLMNELPPHVAVGDRFDVGPLIRATTFANSGYVLAITEGDVRLLFLDSDASSRQIELTSLPNDAADVLDRDVTTGRFDRHRADGTLGPKVEQRRYCSIVQDAVLAAIGKTNVPLVLAAASDLEPAYREVNTYRMLLQNGIEANPASLSLDDLERRGRVVLEEHDAAELSAWRERFGSLKAQGLASSQLSDVAHAATAGQVDTLLFDLASQEEGSIDDAGVITFAGTPGPASYGLVDELAARVLRTGGTVKAVRQHDLPDETPVAATFRSAF